MLVEPGAAARAELVSVVSTALNGRPVTLADDALTDVPLLILERPPRGVLDGRRMDRPERFHLVDAGGTCVLVHEASGRRFPLVEARCAPTAESK